MATPVNKLCGIKEESVNKLKDLKISDIHPLLEAVKTPTQRKVLAKQIGHSACLARINGISGVFSDLLAQAGIDAVKNLAMRQADHLHRTALLKHPFSYSSENLDS